MTYNYRHCFEVPNALNPCPYCVFLPSAGGFLSRGDSCSISNFFWRRGSRTVRQGQAVFPQPTWTAVSGVLSGSVSWPDNSRIFVTTNLTLAAGATLTIGAGTIVRVNYRTDFTNDGNIVINGTRDQPVVFMPNSRAQPWGGFMMRNGTGSISGTRGTFTGHRAVPNWFGTGGNPDSHRKEQALFFVANS